MLASIVEVNIWGSLAHVSCSLIQYDIIHVLQQITHQLLRGRDRMSRESPVQVSCTRSLQP